MELQACIITTRWNCRNVLLPSKWNYRYVLLQRDGTTGMFYEAGTTGMYYHPQDGFTSMYSYQNFELQACITERWNCMHELPRDGIIGIKTKMELQTCIPTHEMQLEACITTHKMEL